MSNLLTMRNRIKSSLAIEGTVYDSLIDDSIRSALLDCQQKPMWFLEAIGTITLLTGSDNILLPSDFASPKDARVLINNTYRSRIDGFALYGFDELQLRLKSQTITGYPTAYAYYAGSIYTDKEADADYTIQITYYKKDATLPQDDTDSSVWFTEGYDVIRSKAMAIFKDECQEYSDGAADRDIMQAQRYLDDLYKRNTQYQLGGSRA